MNQHEIYMHRCLQLAVLGEGHVAPNPMVGSVLVYNDRIIGEGYHRQYGQAHAEVNCLNSVAPEDGQFIPASTLYVSLEPCAHYGKTPPCADRIIKEEIKTVVIGCRDPFEEVDGKGIDRLKSAGVNVIVGILEQQCQSLNKKFFTFHQLKRPYVILKWAETANRMIGKVGERLLISNPVTNRFVHQLRAHEAAILTGTTTTLADDPQLNARLSTGPSPVRLVIDLQNKLPATLNVFDNSQRTIIFNYHTAKAEALTEWCRLAQDKNIAEQILEACYQRQLQSILIEGGAITLQSFIDAGLWDEAIIIQNSSMFVSEGVKAPELRSASLSRVEHISSGTITYYTSNTTQ